MYVLNACLMNRKIYIMRFSLKNVLFFFQLNATHLLHVGGQLVLTRDLSVQYSIVHWLTIFWTTKSSPVLARRSCEMLKVLEKTIEWSPCIMQFCQKICFCVWKAHYFISFWPEKFYVYRNWSLSWILSFCDDHFSYLIATS